MKLEEKRISRKAKTPISNKECPMSKEGVLPVLITLKESERSDSALRYSAVPCSIFCGSLFPVTWSRVKILEFLSRSDWLLFRSEAALIAHLLKT